MNHIEMLIVAKALIGILFAALLVAVALVYVLIKRPHPIRRTAHKPYRKARYIQIKQIRSANHVN